MAAVGAIGPIGGFAAATSPPASGPAAANATGGAPGPGASRAAAPTVAIPSSALPPSSGSVLNGLSELEALAILALLSGNPRNHGADALSAMLIAAALNAYTGVQALAAAPAAAATAGAGPTAAQGIDVRA